MYKFLKTLLLVAATGYAHIATAQGVAVNTTGAQADSTAILDASSTSKGVLVSRMDSLHRAAIANPATGLLIYQTDGTTPGFYNYNGTTWQKVGSTVQPHVQAYTVPGTYIFTTSNSITTSTMFKMTLVAGGGGGGGGYASTGGGGGAGANAIYWATGLSPHTSYTVIIGSGGSGGFLYVSGSQGGNSSIFLGFATLTCTGGNGGLNGGASGAGGTATGGTFNIAGAPGTPGTGSTTGGAGGSSTYGSGGTGALTATSAGSGSGNGSGGGGGNAGYLTGGNGAPGIGVVEWSE